MASAIPSSGPLYHRIATAALFTSDNPTLALNELGLESDTGKYKIGDGVTAWTSLSYGAVGAFVAQAPASAHAAIVTTATTQTTPFGFATQAQGDNIVTLINQIRAALVANGIMV